MSEINWALAALVAIVVLLYLILAERRDLLSRTRDG